MSRVDPERTEILRPLADHLRAIHIACGKPSLRSLRAHTSWLMPSTASEVLNSKSEAKIDFALAFQQACLSLAATAGLKVNVVYRDETCIQRLWTEQAADLAGLAKRRRRKNARARSECEP